ncbi:putative quinol monooxygenase [Nocardioides zeae]|uniref:Antibiotic biosynthesis monooxygenase n=1 Tax=Nocardioides zeae TaxID=1457234 RepID=A0A6P0HNP4_9ACTN|nr:antibiotic biosynthesis monooxygenase family protein [Nocardioides zeae]NEN80319.1 antibiotic biosynthesis monooxygenase [Nocardioides zeae]
MSNQIVVVGHLRVAEDDRDAYVADCVEVVCQARAAPGCLDFVVAADPLEPDRVAVVERWASRADLDAFRSSGPPDEQWARIRDVQVVELDIPQHV